MLIVNERLTLASKESNLGLKLTAYQGMNDDKHIHKIDLTLYPNSGTSDMNVGLALDWAGLETLIDTLSAFRTDCESANHSARAIRQMKREKEDADIAVK